MKRGVCVRAGLICAKFVKHNRIVISSISYITTENLFTRPDSRKSTVTSKKNNELSFLGGVIDYIMGSLAQLKFLGYAIKMEMD